MKSLPWILLLVVVAVLLLKRIGWVSAAEARRLLAGGAVVIDVRTEGEYERDHLPGVINIPVAAMGSNLIKRLPEKEKAILLHCFSGTRSAAACRTLKGQGYTEVHNLGSYSRARRLLPRQE